MDFYDYACATSFQITKKKRDEIKILLRDNISFPILGKDEIGYVVCLAKPKRIHDDHISLQGMLFDSKDPEHRKIIWRLFKASIYHLNLHAAFSDFEVYADWAKDKHINLATYVVSTLEDAVVNAYLRKLWSPLILDIAYANAIAHLRLKPASLIPDDTLQVMTSTLSSFTTGMTKGKLSDEMQKDVDDLTFFLREMENLTYKELLKESKSKNKKINSDGFIAKKISFAEKMYELSLIHI